jgi:membrane-associated protease RseP (regulator of RpoE activity)
MRGGHEGPPLQLFMDESIKAVTPNFQMLPRYWTNPTAREWRFHIALLLLTILTTVLSGVWLATPELQTPEPPLARPLDYLLYLPLAYVSTVAGFLKYVVSHPSLLLQGGIFSSCLLAILLSHEMGHYLACRYYGVAATLPYFIPAPPLFLAGTFGAFIKIRSPIPSRRALFDIGLAGPLAGFVVAFFISVIGFLVMQPPAGPAFGIVFSDPLLFKLLAKVLHVELAPNSPINPYYMAAWIGLLVTSLNLMPVGQLDGGHGTFAVFGARAHRILGIGAFFTIGVLAILGFWWYHSPSGFLYTVLLGIMLRVPHPPPAIMESLGTKRAAIAILTLLVFVLCFCPFPISVS